MCRTLRPRVATFLKHTSKQATVSTSGLSSGALLGTYKVAYVPCLPGPSLGSVRGLAFCPKRADTSQGPGQGSAGPALSAGGGHCGEGRPWLRPCRPRGASSPVTSAHTYPFLLLMKGPASPSLLRKDLLARAGHSEMQVRLASSEWLLPRGREGDVGKEGRSSEA